MKNVYFWSSRRQVPTVIMFSDDLHVSGTLTPLTCCEVMNISYRLSCHFLIMINLSHLNYGGSSEHIKCTYNHVMWSMIYA